MICNRCFSWMGIHPEVLGFRKCLSCAYCKKEVKIVISLQELNPKKFELDDEQKANLLVLHEKINKVRELWATPMVITSGFRSLEDHLKIYKELALKRNVPFDESKVPMGSQHLKGAACDVSDPEGKLYDWCQDNVDKLEEIGLWCEEKDNELRVHFQICPPKSGDRFFKP